MARWVLQKRLDERCCWRVLAPGRRCANSASATGLHVPLALPTFSVASASLPNEHRAPEGPAIQKKTGKEKLMTKPDQEELKFVTSTRAASGFRRSHQKNKSLPSQMPSSSAWGRLRSSATRQ